VSKLPFVVAPRTPELRRVGNEVTGVLEIPVLGGITVGEAAVVAELLANEQQAFVQGARIADAIAKEENITLSEAFHIVEAGAFGKTLEPTADEIRTRHAERIAEITKIYATAGRRNMEATVTALLRCRLNLPHWSTEDTRTMHEVLFNGVLELAREEQDAENMVSSPITEEDLKKQPPETTTPPKRTGRKSSTT